MFDVKNGKCVAFPLDGTDPFYLITTEMNDAEKEIYLPQILKQGLEGRHWVGHTVKTMTYYLIL